MILDKFSQPVLVERYIAGREINVGLLGNGPPEAFPPAEILFDRDGPPIYTHEDKARTSGRQITVRCPAAIDPELTERAQSLAREAFIRLRPCPEFTDERVVWTWETPAGLKDGTLLVVHIDVPMEATIAAQPFRRHPERVYGEGIGSSRAPLVALIYALRSVRSLRLLHRTPVGVLVYADEGRDCRDSEKIIRAAAACVKSVLVLFPGNPGDHIVTSRRGQRRYRLTAAGEPLRLGRPTKKTEVLRWLCGRLEACAGLSSRQERIAVATAGIETRNLTMLLPHEATATIFVTYPDESAADRVERDIRRLLNNDRSVKWRLELVSDRPPMKEQRRNSRLARELQAVAEEWEIPLEKEASVWPSVAGLVPASAAVVCAVGPVTRNLYMPDESVDRTSLIQRTLILAEFLRRQALARASTKQKPA